MCKSASQPGGPYRCSNDASKSLDAARAARDRADAAYQEATAAVTACRERRSAALHDMDAAVNDPDAVYERGGRELPAAQHVEEMISAGEVPESDRARPVSEVFSDYRDHNGLSDDDDQVPRHFAEPGSAFDLAEDRWIDANKDLNEATANYLATRRAYADASARVGEAAAAYDATPRGLAEASAARDDIDETEHPAQARVLDSRLEEATGRMNKDAALRTRRWGGGQVTHAVVPRSRADLEPSKEPFVAMAREDGVRSTAENHGYYLDGRTGAEGEAYVVSLHNEDKTVKVQYPQDTRSAPPSQADVLHRMSDVGGAYERASGGPDGNLRTFRRNWDRRDDDFDDDEAREATLTEEFSAGKRYSQQLRALFGDERAQNYMETAAPRAAAARV